MLSPVNLDGSIGVKATNAYSAAAGFVWLSPPISQTNGFIGVNGALDDLRRDGHQGSSLQTFRVDVANGTYTGILTIGTAHSALDDVQVSANGVVIASDVDVPNNTWVQITFTATVVNGMIQFEFSDPVPNRRWSVNGLELRQTADVEAITLAGANNTVIADGMTVTAIMTNLTGLAIGSTVTVSTSLGTITTVDTEPAIAGVQTVVGAGGVIDFAVQAPTVDGVPTFTVTAVDGSAIGEITDGVFLTYELPTVRRLDFNSGNSPTQAGFAGVRTDLLNASNGFGYLNDSPLTHASSLGISVTSKELYRDGHFGSQNIPSESQTGY